MDCEKDEIVMPSGIKFLKWINIIFGCLYLLEALIIFKGNGDEAIPTAWIYVSLFYAFCAVVSFVLAYLICKVKRSAFVIGGIWYGLALLQAVLSLNILRCILMGICLAIVLGKNSKEYFAGTYRVELPEDMNEEELIEFYGIRKKSWARGLLVSMAVILAITSAAVGKELLFPPYSAPFNHVMVIDWEDYNTMMEEIEAFGIQIDDAETLVIDNEKSEVMDTLCFMDESGTVIITGKDIVSCKKWQEPQSGQISIQFKLTEEGKASFAAATERISGFDSPNQYISIMLEDEVIAEPIIQEKITGGEFNLTLCPGEQEQALDELFKD